MNTDFRNFVSITLRSNIEPYKRLQGDKAGDPLGGKTPPQSEDGKKIFFTDVVMRDVSATNIRRLASEGRMEELTGLVPGPVLEYIKKYGIYRELNEAKLNS